MDQPTVNGTPDTIEMTLPATAANGVAVKPYEAPRASPVANMRDLAARVDGIKDTAIEDAAELRWWRTQFATRFPAGQLPKPGTALVGRHFHLSEGEWYPHPSFHVGVDLAEKPSKTMLSLVQGGKVLAIAELDHQDAMYEVFRKAGTALSSVYEHLARQMEMLARQMLRVITEGVQGLPVDYITPSTKAYLANMEKLGAAAGESLAAIEREVIEKASAQAQPPDGYSACTKAPPVPDPNQCPECHETKGPEHWCPAWMKEVQASRPTDNYNELHGWVVGRMVELTALGYTPLQLATQGFCCAIGGVHAVTDQKPCPLHAPKPGPYTGDYDTLDFLKP